MDSNKKIYMSKLIAEAQLHKDLNSKFLVKLYSWIQVS